MNAANALIETRGLTAHYGDAQALFGIDFTLNAGEVVAIIGANGAGKSTFLKTLTGLVKAPRDAVRFHGQPVGSLSPGAIVRQGLAMVPEGRRLFPSLNVEENLLMGAFARRPGPWNLKRLFALFPILESKRRSPAPALSGGQQQMVAIGRALMSRPQLLLLDEPFLGVAPIIIGEVMAALSRLSDEGVTLLLVEQNIHRTMDFVTRAYVIENGRSVLEGNRETLLDDPKFTSKFLGLE
jgi:branched-chain amino acid transport system ATP-binding protein